MKRTIIIVVTTLAVSIFLLQQSHAQGWQFFGPDSMHWRNTYQMDGVFHKDLPPRIAVAVSRGISVNLGSEWKYLLRNFRFGFPPFFSSGDYWGVYFSPWNDSVAFVKVRGISGEASYGCFIRVNNVFVDSTWSRGFAAPCCQFCLPVSLVFAPYDTDKVYVMLDHLYKSTDNGQTWTRQSMRFISYFVLFFLSNAFCDSTLYYGERSLMADSFTVSLSENDGLTWNRILTLPSSFSKADMLAQGDTLILGTSKSNGAGNDCGIYRSINQGATWIQVLASVNVNALAHDKGHPEIMYAATQNGIYRTFDAGINWHLFNNALPTHRLVDILKDPYSDTIYVATDLGVYKVFNSVVKVNDNEWHTTPIQFSLRQNFPNPFNPTTTVEYEVVRRAVVSIVVYDISGRAVQQLANSTHEPGVYRLRFDGSHLASGIYSCTMKAGAFSDTKQMTFLK